MTDLEDARKFHVEDQFGYCEGCGLSMPCEVIRLADEIERLREAMESVCDWVRQGSLCDSDPPYKIARAALERYGYEQYEEWPKGSRARAAVERQLSRISDYQDACSQKQEIINGQKEEIERLRAALEVGLNGET